jgi:DNA-binding phage protein
MENSLLWHFQSHDDLFVHYHITVQKQNAIRDTFKARITGFLVSAIIEELRRQKYTNADIAQVAAISDDTIDRWYKYQGNPDFYSVEKLRTAVNLRSIKVPDRRTQNMVALLHTITFVRVNCITKKVPSHNLDEGSIKCLQYFVDRLSDASLVQKRDSSFRVSVITDAICTIPSLHSKSEMVASSMIDEWLDAYYITSQTVSQLFS